MKIRIERYDNDSVEDFWEIVRIVKEALLAHGYRYAYRYKYEDKIYTISKIFKERGHPKILKEGDHGKEEE